LEYIAEFEVYPEVSREGIEQLEISRPHAEIQDNDLENMLAKLREQKKEWQSVERASQKKDRVTINFSGVSEEENFTDGKVENYQVEIGGNQMIPGFEDELIGLNAGESKTFDINFPEEYGNAKLAGKTATFEVDMVAVEEPVLPEINEDFIKAYGIDDGNMDTFRTDVKDNMQRELDQALKGKLKNAVMDALVGKIQLSVPKALIDQEVLEVKKPYEANAKRQNMSLEEMDFPVGMFEEQAKRRVALGLILGEIIRKNDIKADDDKVRAEIAKMASSYETPDEVVNWYYADESRLRDVQQIVLEDLTVDWIINQAKMNDETISFDDAMGNR
jgi:trigger factor